MWTTCIRKEQKYKDFAHNPVQHPILSAPGFAIKGRLEHWNNVWGELQFSSAAETTVTRKSRDHWVASEKRWEIHIARNSEWDARGNGFSEDAENLCKHSECDLFHDHGWRNSRCFKQGTTSYLHSVGRPLVLSWYTKISSECILWKEQLQIK